MVKTMSESLSISAVICYRYALNAIFGLLAYTLLCWFEDRVRVSFIVLLSPLVSHFPRHTSHVPMSMPRLRCCLFHVCLTAQCSNAARIASPRPP